MSTTRMTRRGGILLHTMITVMVPLLAVVLALGYHFTNAYMQDARDRLDTRGQFMAKHLASLSEFSVYAMNFVELRKHAESILDEPDVAEVTIRDSDDNLLITVSNNSMQHTESNLITFGARVIRSGVTVEDYPEEESTGELQTAEVIGRISITLSDKAVISKQKDILYKGIVITILGLLLSFALALFVARSVTLPIRRLTETVGELTSGHLGARTLESSPGELGTLQHGINQMAESLEGARQELVKEVDIATTALQQTVMQLEQRNVDLDIAREEAQRAGDAKAEFLARMSHEIRTPLSAVIGFSHLLEQTPQSETQNEYTRTITQAASQLLLIIDDILDFSRLNAGTLRMENKSFDLHESLENMIGILSTSAHDRQLELVLLIHSDVPQHIQSDEKRINQILTNLGSNAIKFTEQGHVVVNVSSGETDGNNIMLNIEVTDTGIGLDEDQADDIFNPFTQADISTSRKFGGTGLGLAICRHLTNLLGGSITVKSTPGHGATFTVLLPVIYTSDAQQLAKPLAGLGVLICDTNPFTLRSLRNRFILWGTTVFYTADPGKFMQMLEEGRQQPYDLIVYGLPAAQPGHTAIRERIEAIRKISISPLLILAGQTAHDLQPTAEDDASVAFITKPARSDRMLRIVGMLTGTTDTHRHVMPATERKHVTGSEPALQGIRILMAEDNNFNQKLLQHILQNQGIDVTVATNGRDACKRATAAAYDMILMDIHMPVMGGMEAIRIIRNGINRDTPIIILTADVFACTSTNRNESGIDDCLNKPVSEDRLLHLLHKWISHSKDDIKYATPANSSALDYCTDEFPDPAVNMPCDFNRQIREELGNQLSSIRDKLEEDMVADMLEHVHQLKGIVDYFNLQEFKQEFQRLQQAVDAGQRDAIFTSLGVLEKILDDTRSDSD